jgi:hypothetical protein
VLSARRAESEDGMISTKTQNKHTTTNNVVVTYRTSDGKTFCGRFKTMENALKEINSNKWNSPKNLGWEVVEIREN